MKIIKVDHIMKTMHVGSLKQNKLNTVYKYKKYRDAVLLKTLLT